MFRMKFLTKRIFRIFPILRTVGMAPFWNLFMERPSYKGSVQVEWSVTVLSCIYRFISTSLATLCTPMLLHSLQLCSAWQPSMLSNVGSTQ